MLKKIIGITLLVGVIGLLAFGAIQRTYAESETALPAAEEYGQGYGGEGNGYSEIGEPLLLDGTGAGYGEGEPLIDTLPVGELNQAETDALLFMYEEEKMARDVYQAFSLVYTQPMFANIARSEQTHMDSVSSLLERYELAVPGTDEAGVFTNPDLQALYDQLTASGSQSLAAALKASAAIEEIDILDLKERLAQTDQADIQLVFENLLSGSYNHLASFSSVYTNEAGTEYEPQYLPLEDYQEIVADALSAARGNGRGAGGGGH